MCPDPEPVLQRVREICLALPAGRERLSHGSPGFHIEKGKFFAYFWHNHHGDGITAVHVKTSGLDEQGMLTQMLPDLYFRPPYLGPSGWVGIRLDSDEVDWELVSDRIGQSWALIAPRKLQEAARPDP